MKLNRLALFLSSYFIATSGFADKSESDTYHCLTAMASRTITTDFGKYLQLEHCNLNDSDMIKVASYLQKHADIDYLILSYNMGIGKEGYSYIGKVGSLRNISLVHNDLKDSDLSAVFQNKNYQNIDLSHNSDLTPDGLSGVLSNQVFLKTLFLDYNELRDEHALKLASVLSNINLEILSVAGNHIGPSGGAALAKLRLDGLNLANNHVRDEGATNIAKSSHIPVLYLMGNKIGNEGAAALAKYWYPQYRYTQYLPYLELSENSIGDEGALALAHNNISADFSLNVLFNMMSFAAVESLCRTNNISYLTADDGCGNSMALKRKQPESSLRDKMKIILR